MPCPAADCVWFVNSLVFVCLTSDVRLFNAPPAPLSSSCRRYHRHQHHHRGHRGLHPLPRPHSGCHSLVLQVSVSTFHMRTAQCYTFFFLEGIMDQEHLDECYGRTEGTLTSLHRSYKQRRYVESDVHRRFCRFAPCLSFHLIWLLNENEGV